MDCSRSVSSDMSRHPTVSTLSRRHTRKGFQFLPVGTEWSTIYDSADTEIRRAGCDGRIATKEAVSLIWSICI